MTLRILLYILIGASLTACSSHLEVILPSSGKIALQETNVEKEKIAQFIQPYKDSVQLVMSEVIAQSDLSLESGRPNSLLGNWTTDALFDHETAHIRLSEPIFCLLTNGGLRSSIGKGTVSRGDIFRLMPFDNEVVWVRLPMSSLAKIESYLIQSGGEPISNASMHQGKLSINGMNDRSTHFWVITSDYLANGGDQMSFFQDAVERQNKKVLLREVFIQACIKQGTLVKSNDKRID